MHGIQHKLNETDKAKIRARFQSKVDEYSKLSVQELEALRSTKISSTDRHACEFSIDQVIKAKIAKEMELSKSKTNDITASNEEETQGDAISTDN